MVHFVGIPCELASSPPFLSSAHPERPRSRSFCSLRLLWPLHSLSCYWPNSPPPSLLPLIILQMPSCKGVLCLLIYCIFSSRAVPPLQSSFQREKKNKKENIVTPWENKAVKRLEKPYFNSLCKWCAIQECRLQMLTFLCRGVSQMNVNNISYSLLEWTFKCSYTMSGTFISILDLRTLPSYLTGIFGVRDKGGMI